MLFAGPGAPPPILEGKRVGRYVVGSLVGSGGMGAVYRAEDPFLRRTVALKILSPSLLPEVFGRERFFREARAIARLEHPNIVRIYEAADDADIPYIAMEFVDGADAGSLLASNPPLDVTLGVILQVLSGLAAAHEHGVVHRDVKPGNILVGADGTAKLIDFGLARLTGEDRDLTQGAVFGTVSYMSPEQVRDSGEIDHRTDIYAVGALLFQLVAGRPPFAKATLAETLVAIVHEPAPDLSVVAPHCSSALSGIIASCLAKRREDRPASARVLAAQLSGVLGESKKREVGQRLEASRPVPAPPPPVAPVSVSADLEVRSQPVVTELDEHAPDVSLSSLEEFPLEAAPPPEVGFVSDRSAPRMARPRSRRPGLTIGLVLAGASIGLGAGAMFVLNSRRTPTPPVATESLSEAPVPSAPESRPGTPEEPESAVLRGAPALPRLLARETGPAVSAAPARPKPGRTPNAASLPRTPPEDAGPAMVALAPPPTQTRLTLALGDTFRFRVSVRAGSVRSPRWSVDDYPAGEGNEFVYIATKPGHRQRVSVTLEAGGDSADSFLMWYVTVSP